MEPEGAFYIFPDFSSFKDNLFKKGISNSVDLCRKLLEDTGIAILPGSVFGEDPNNLIARLSFVDFDGSKALAAAEQIPNEKQLNSEFLKMHFSHTIEALEKLKEWLKN